MSRHLWLEDLPRPPELRHYFDGIPVAHPYGRQQAGCRRLASPAYYGADCGSFTPENACRERIRQLTLFIARLLQSARAPGPELVTILSRYGMTK